MIRRRGIQQARRPEYKGEEDNTMRRTRTEIALLVALCASACQVDEQSSSSSDEENGQQIVQCKILGDEVMFQSMAMQLINRKEIVGLSKKDEEGVKNCKLGKKPVVEISFTQGTFCEDNGFRDAKFQYRGCWNTDQR